MNQLSQLLYWADVFSNLGPILLILGTLFTIIAIILSCICFDGYRDDDDQKPIKKAILGFGLTAFVFIVSAIFVPSKETVYAIAASEVGEQVLKSPIVGKAEKALETWLDKQINSK